MLERPLKKFCQCHKLPIPHLKTWTFCLCVGVFFNVCYAEKWVWAGGKKLLIIMKRVKMKIILYFTFTLVITRQISYSRCLWRRWRTNWFIFGCSFNCEDHFHTHMAYACCKYRFFPPSIVNIFFCCFYQLIFSQKECPLWKYGTAVALTKIISVSFFCLSHKLESSSPLPSSKSSVVTSSNVSVQ